jgi:N-acetylmuramoyl-L-alanine amidase
VAEILRSKLGKQLNLKIDEIGTGRPNRPGSPLTVRYITVHNTDNQNPGADAEAHARFLKNNGSYVQNGRTSFVSWHYSVDDDSCVRHLPLNEVGWHTGSRAGNATSIGIEICMNAGIDQKAAFARATKLIACLCYDLQLDPLTQVVPHGHWSNKNCPRLLLENGTRGAKWDDFIEGIAALERTIVPK